MMIGLGTIINTCAIIIGGLLGILLQNVFTARVQDTLLKANGVCVLFIGIGGALQEMLALENGRLVSGSSMMIILSCVIGSLLGAVIDIERRIEPLGSWLKQKTKSESDAGFLEGFVSASLTVCIGAMAVVGAIQDGIQGDYSMLLAKSVLDFIIVMIMAAVMGKGCVFSAIPVAVLQGTITVLARFIKPVMTDQAISNLSLTGSILIFRVGVNLVWGPQIKVANMLPAILFAVAFAFLL